ncbi:hypothetical protein DH2020_049229 [Rehmannia glutinosa]|uniref:DUF1985 domain-containing protein n=1 Tax=Rehmannia glutinosa TaxID=99300 RepID=A0ABR0U461_REHGL
MKDYMKVSCKLLHSLIMMRIESRAADEIWFCLGGKKVRFSFWDFTLITGLNPSNEDRYENDIPSGRRLAEEYFQGRKVVKPGELRDAFYTDAKNEDDRYKLGLALIYENVLKCKEINTSVDMEVLNIVDNLELFNKYPWGRKCYDILLYGLRKGFSKVPLAHYSLWGFPLALQVWAFETVPAIRKFFRAKRTEQRLPRMCGWKSTLTCSFDEIIELLNAPINEILFPLTPTNKEEEQEYVRLFPTISEKNGPLIWSTRSRR